MSFKTLAVLLIVTIIVASTVATQNQEKDVKAKELKQQKVLAAHAEFVQSGLLGRAAMGGPRHNLGKGQPPAHTQMKRGGFV